MHYTIIAVKIDQIVIFRIKNNITLNHMIIEIPLTKLTCVIQQDATHAILYDHRIYIT